MSKRGSGASFNERYSQALRTLMAEKMAELLTKEHEALREADALAEARKERIAQAASLGHPPADGKF